jgi:2-polyprenyl-3-methyl-5-hydroxy-6-metoxy-1,4-benzoquinol methylase
MVGKIISIILQNTNKKRKLRILEIGGGNGLLTREIVPFINNENVEYYFTDITEIFVKKMQEQNTMCNMKFGLLDISKSPIEQGFEKHGFDLKLGYDVVHATKSIGETISNIKELLAPNGMIGIIDIICQQRWQHMIFGMAEGWWYFEDEDVRKESPLLSLRKWEQVFHNHGFNTVKTYSNSDKKYLVEHGLIVAQ